MRAFRLVLALGLVSGCTGNIGEPPRAVDDPSRPSDSPSDPNDPLDPNDPRDPNDPNDPNTPPPPDEPAPNVRAVRLTHVQWQSSVVDLFGLPAGAPDFTTGFRADPAQSGFIFDNDGNAMVVDQTLWSAYERAAADVAAHVVDDPARRDAVLPPDQGDAEARARAFIEDLGRRAHRRPLTAAQVDAYFDVYVTGRDNPGDRTPFDAGIALVIQAVLQSPYFLYRLELSTEADDGVIPLDGYEVAQRLSYALWNTMPDEALLSAAEAGELADPVRVAEHARRMLADPRAEDVVARFHTMLLDVKKFSSIAPSGAFFPDAPDDLAELAVTENDLYIRDAFTSDRGWRFLLTATETFVNDDLARIYGLDGEFGAAFERASLLDSQRRGIFTHVGFLASQATSVNPDPIHRGVFLTERIACNPLGAPPNNLPPLPPPMGRTNREVVEDHTETPGSVCASCHTTLINPFGFPYEMFDAIGQHRTEDSGYPVDTTAEPLIGGENVPVSNALELADRLADSEAVHECYAEHWVQYILGRGSEPEDAGIVHELATESLDGGSIRELLVALVTSDSFLTRSVEELP